MGSKTTAVRKPAAASRIAFFVLFMVTMVAATLQIGNGDAQAATAGLSWSAPTTNTDGTPISDLAGYKIYIGSASRSYQQTIDVGSRTDYSVANLNDGATYYFAVTAYNSAGVESPYSTEATKSFPAATTTYTLTAYAGTGGSITPANNSSANVATSGTTTITTVKVAKGASQTFSITPAAGYAIADVKANGVSVGVVTSYTFNNVATSQWMSATFKPATETTAIRTITSYAGQGGSITALNNTRVAITTSGTTTKSSVTVTQGASQTFNITPAAGYAIANVTVNGASIGVVASYTFDNVTKNQWMSATFKAATTTTPTPTAGKVVFAMNGGGAQFTDAAGAAYVADAYFTGGNAGTMAIPINNTTDDALYQSERWGASSYNIPLTNGNYNLTLKFAETYWTAAGKRVFDVAVNGTTMVSDLDIFAKAGKDTAYDVVLPVTVTNGALSVKFLNKIDNAKICAMKVTTR